MGTVCSRTGRSARGRVDLVPGRLRAGRLAFELATYRSRQYAKGTVRGTEPQTCRTLTGKGLTHPFLKSPEDPLTFCQCSLFVPGHVSAIAKSLADVSIGYDASARALAA